MTNFTEMSNDELMTIDGGLGLFTTCILIIGGSTLAGFGIGYGLTYWLGQFPLYVWRYTQAIYEDDSIL